MCITSKGRINFEAIVGKCSLVNLPCKQATQSFEFEVLGTDTFHLFNAVDTTRLVGWPNL